VTNWNEYLSKFDISSSTWHTLTETRPFSDFLFLLGMCATLIVTLLTNDVGVQIHALTPIGKYATIQIVAQCPEYH